MIEVREEMVAKTGRQRARRWKAWNWWWEDTDLTKAKANPATRMDSVVTKSGGSRSHVELPRVTAPTQGKSREVSATGKVG